MPHLATYVGLVDHAEQTLAQSFRVVGRAQQSHPDVYFTCTALASMSDAHREQLAPVITRYGTDDAAGNEPERLHAAGLAQARTGPLGLVRDLQDLQVLAQLVLTSWTVIQQAAQGLRDTELLDVATSSSAETSRQIAWLNTHLKVVAPQALIVAE